MRVAVLGTLGLLAMAASSAHASVTLLLEQPYGELGAFNPTGHSALYFDQICADDPLTLRACRPGELGAVISRYDGIDRLDWLAMPLVPYLYAVETGAEIPETADRALANRLRDRYRKAHLEVIAPDTASGAVPQGNWYELVGGSYDRTIFGFQVKTTPAQDQALIAFFNDRSNHERYNGMLNNCADFSRVVLNMLYPHAVRRNYIADLGMTTPKSVARALVHYAKHHPETELKVMLIPQVPGTIHRSVDVEGVSESLLKRYGIPLIILSPHTTAVIFAAYVTHGRFALPKKAPVLDVAALERDTQAEAMRGNDLADADLPEGVFRLGDEAGSTGAATLATAPVEHPPAAARSVDAPLLPPPAGLPARLPVAPGTTLGTTPYEAFRPGTPAFWSFGPSSQK